MKLPNGYGSVVKLSGKRRKPYQVRKTTGWHYDKEKDRLVQDMITVGYAATRAEGLQMLAEYNNNPFDTKAAKMTLQHYSTRSSTLTFNAFAIFPTVAGLGF